MRREAQRKVGRKSFRPAKGYVAHGGVAHGLDLLCKSVVVTADTSIGSGLGGIFSLAKFSSGGERAGRLPSLRWGLLQSPCRPPRVRLKTEAKTVLAMCENYSDGIWDDESPQSS